jgi:Metal binding domain of Ada
VKDVDFLRCQAMASFCLMSQTAKWEIYHAKKHPHALFLTSLITTSAFAQLVSPIVPDPAKTPGDTLAVTKADICVPGYSKKVRNVPESVKKQAYAEYGIASHQPKEYEVDHLISLELGGSNSLKNLWPQSYVTSPYNAHKKDVLENKLHKLVCDGVIDLKTTQKAISTDWITAYRKYVGTDIPPLGGGGGNTAPVLGGRSGQIVGNKNSRIYHLPGCPGYNSVSAANRVTFRTSAEAEEAGYRKAKNCH